MNSRTHRWIAVVLFIAIAAVALPSPVANNAIAVIVPAAIVVALVMKVRHNHRQRSQPRE